MSPARPAPPVKAQAAAPLFAALGDATRLEVLLRLSQKGPGSITQLSAESAVSRQAITKHLKVLSDAGFVKGSRSGREHIWRLRAKRLEETRDYLEHISREWDDALNRLKAFVED